MAFCKYCGKELDKDGNCTCEASMGKSVPEREHIKADKAPEGGLKKALIIIGIIAVLAVIGGIALFIFTSANAYKKPIKNMVKGVNRGDTDRIISAMYTEDEQSELKVRAKDSGLDWDTYVSDNDKTIDTIRKSKNIKRIKVDIVAKEKLDGSNLTDVENYYKQSFGEEVKKAYRVEVKFTVKYKDGNKTDDGWLTVAKIKDGGWVYCPEGSDTFDYMKDLTKLL
ncbi:hypothetical protein SAMN02910353_01732 [Ruminococcus sp. YRD2003]|uniref:hypothetical protein n=1 Tax=Ruminococcus sp. YRD2003 TaxID=1452313 RepID=UPI0008D41A30|nr:hypothetical protein SAMN02910353_01732 [Ruminococcus flavefaciens]